MTSNVLQFPQSKRSEWTGWDEHLFEHLRRHGKSIAEASARVAAEIASRNVPDEGSERLLRMAREALARSPRIQKSPAV